MKAHKRYRRYIAMKRYLLFPLIVLMFCAVVSAGCGGGGGSDSPDSEQSENVSGETGEDTGDYDPNDGGRGASGSISVHIDTCSAYKANYLTFYGLNSDGKWEEIAHYSRRLYGKDTTGNKDFTASKSYSAFGFEFDIDSGTNWPYSGVFWKEGDSSGISLSNMNSI